ncbi:DUF262 domain-containing protein [Aliarcobacter butzleri]|uniref:DUF262 domain-containing protein n=1 Tax=Aliarcobacter butzleri TaxID=28197 RepID=UPI003AED44B1
MSNIIANEYRNATIMKIFYEREMIDLQPDYQRLGNIWSIQKKQLLIDSIINEYDIPKIYFHEKYPVIDHKKYAVIDGRQRLEAIFDFIEGKFTLSDSIEYNRDKAIKLGKLNYKELGEQFPYIKINFDSFVLPIIIIQTEDLELIEDMFSRLNDGVLLNAAEKRNAFGGQVINNLRELIKNDFFTDRLKISNNRFQHFEIAARFLLIEERINKKAVIDTSKNFLDTFVEENKKNTSIIDYYHNSINVLNKMNNTFIAKDNLLKRQGDMVIYYLLFKIALDNEQSTLITREKIDNFQKEIFSKSGLDEDVNNLDYVTYYNYSQQGTNGFSNIKIRLRIMMNFIGINNKINTYDYLFKV